MSGSGDSSFGGPPIGGAQCQDINTITTVASPDPKVLATINVGDYLDIILRTPTGPIIAVTRTGGVLGAILIVNIAQLINCINEGSEYQGRVRSIEGGDCKILITSK